MSLIHKTIFTGFSPNSTVRDVRLACAYLFFPWKWISWREGEYPAKVEERLQHYFNTSHAVTMDSGRSALLASLQALGIQTGDEVLVQAYTCVVVINAILFAGGTPVYVDIGADFCMDPDDIKKKITPKTKALIVQHTFGQAADMDTIMTLAKEHTLAVVEDCAHSFGATYKGKLLGTFGDIAIVSFGSDKVVSSVRGGAVITNSDLLAAKVREKVREFPLMNIHILLRHLLHYPFFFLGRAWYSFGLGKALLAFAKRAQLINSIIEPSEKKSEQSLYFPAKFPNALARIAFLQIAEVDKVNAKRKQIARVYTLGLRGIDSIRLPPIDEECIYLRYTIRTNDAGRIRHTLRRQGVYLGDWYDTVIAPKDIDMSRTGYTPGSCPVAERIAQESVNLPTGRHITQKDVTFIIDALHACLALPSNK